MDQFRVLGVMSGSSLDGIDLCYAHFFHLDGNWSYTILDTETIPLEGRIGEKMKTADQTSTTDLLELDVQYGEWVGTLINEWLNVRELRPQLIGFHGHTVYHEPNQKISLQIGNGPAIACKTGLPLVDNFRLPDLLKGGQGAPLVPAGEHHLFPEYDGFLNLGGIANISVHKKRILAWDVAPCNQILNHFAALLGEPYDKGGMLASKGFFSKSWYDPIMKLPYFQQSPPKSLSNQWKQAILDLTSPDPLDALHTYSLLLASQVKKDLTKYFDEGKIMITGGGAFNNFLIDELKKIIPDNIKLILPDPVIISFKEALIFGFLALLKHQNQPNIFCSVTGASSDSCSGTIHLPA